MTMQTVVMDTNALLMPFEIGINIDAEIRGILGEARIVIPGPVIGELKHLTGSNRFARPALALARSREIVQCDGHGDDAVIEAAQKLGGYILTNDKELRRRARTLRIPLLYLRSGTHLIAETYRSAEERRAAGACCRKRHRGGAEAPAAIQYFISY